MSPTAASTDLLRDSIKVQQMLRRGVADQLRRREQPDNRLSEDLIHRRLGEAREIDAAAYDNDDDSRLAQARTGKKERAR